MSGLIKQFFALPAEFNFLLKKGLSDTGLFVMAVNRENGGVSVVDDVNCLNCSNIQTLYFSRFAPLDAPKGRFVEANPAVLIVRIGMLENNILKESVISCKTEDEQSFKNWKSISNFLVKHTISGAIITNPETGSSGFFRFYRFSEGVVKEQSGGLKLRTHGNHLEVKPGKP